MRYSYNWVATFNEYASQFFSAKERAYLYEGDDVKMKEWLCHGAKPPVPRRVSLLYSYLSYHIPTRTLDRDILSDAINGYLIRIFLVQILSILGGPCSGNLLNWQLTAALHYCPRWRTRVYSTYIHMHTRLISLLPHDSTQDDIEKVLSAPSAFTQTTHFARPINTVALAHIIEIVASLAEVKRHRTECSVPLSRYFPCAFRVSYAPRSPCSSHCIAWAPDM